MLPSYSDTAPERSELDASRGLLVLEFGSNDCGICAAATPHIAAALQATGLSHLRIQDGKGRRLGRSYGIKLWPTLVLLRDGKEQGRVVRPQDSSEIATALRLLQQN